LTVVQAVIRFSLPTEGAIEGSEIKRRLMDRIQSMSDANRAITDSMGDGVQLTDLIANEIRGFESRFEISGAAGITLDPQMTQNFSLILHELLTNTLKYGALSVPLGRVRLRFNSVLKVVSFTWQEHGGPRVAPPTSSGFGSRILGTFAKSFCRNVDISYGASGLRYTLDIDADRFERVEAPAAASAVALPAASRRTNQLPDAIRVPI
jgi:two-component sensor histidine kinase